MRISKGHLDAKAAIAADLTGRNLVVAGAYGGWDVHELVKDGHGAIHSLMGGYLPAKEVAAFLDGMIEAARGSRNA